MEISLKTNNTGWILPCTDSMEGLSKRCPRHLTSGLVLLRERCPRHLTSGLVLRLRCKVWCMQHQHWTCHVLHLPVCLCCCCLLLLLRRGVAFLPLFHLERIVMARTET